MYLYLLIADYDVGVIGELANDIFRIQRFQICCIHDESRWSDSGYLDDAGCYDLKCGLYAVLVCTM